MRGSLKSVHVRQVLQLQGQGMDCCLLQVSWLGTDYLQGQGPQHLERGMGYWTLEERLEQMRPVKGKGCWVLMILWVRMVQMTPKGLGMGL